MRTLAAMSPVYKEVAESMATSNIEPAEVSMARYHDRYVSGMRGSYAAGWDARQEEVNAITDKLDTAEKKLDVTEKKLDATEKKLDATAKELAAFAEQVKELQKQLGELKK